MAQDPTSTEGRSGRMRLHVAVFAAFMVLCTGNASAQGDAQGADAEATTETRRRGFSQRESKTGKASNNAPRTGSCVPHSDGSSSRPKARRLYRAQENEMPDRAACPYPRPRLRVNLGRQRVVVIQPDQSLTRAAKTRAAVSRWSLLRQRLLHRPARRRCRCRES